MAGIRIPASNEITLTQKRAISLGKKRKYTLVVGSPGTGKTVVSVLVAQENIAKRKRVLMLVYNTTLYHYLRNSVCGAGNRGEYVEVYTWNEWFPAFYRKIFGKSAPRTFGNKYDWKQIKEEFKDFVNRPDGILPYNQIILDEAQDLPIGLIECLMPLTDRLLCSMDDNQQLNKDGCSVDEVQELLDVEPEYLTENYRNTTEIFEFAKQYLDELPETSVDTHGAKPLFVHCCDEETMLKRMEEIILYNYDLAMIGVIIPSGAYLDRTFRALKNRIEGKVQGVYYYNTSTNQYLDFNNDGVYVLSQRCMKGLQFDAVLIPYCNRIVSDFDERAGKNTFYVKLTRACEKVYCFYLDEVPQKGWTDILSTAFEHKDLVRWEEAK